MYAVATLSVVMSLRPASTTSLLRRSVTTIKLVHPSLSGKPVIKSIETSFQIRSGIGKGRNKPWRPSLHDFTRPQTKQFRTYWRTVWLKEGQKYSRATAWYETFLPGCPKALEECMACIMPVLKGSLSGTHFRFRYNRLPDSSRRHSAIDSLRSRAVGNLRSPFLTASQAD